MMPCIYCIGCKWYRSDEKIWCAHPDRENCIQRNYWEDES